LWWLWWGGEDGHGWEGGGGVLVVGLGVDVAIMARYQVDGC
jgi:hypothetical protein